MILNEIHAGDCGHHDRSRSLVSKAFRHGFYWLTAHADAEEIVRRCDGCQKFGRQMHVPAQELRMIPITWPFAVWGLDMVGPFKMSSTKKTHILVAVDKFTKWVEAEPVSCCDTDTAVKFLKKLIFRFGYPHSIITVLVLTYPKVQCKSCVHESISGLMFPRLHIPVYWTGREGKSGNITGD